MSEVCLYSLGRLRRGLRGLRRRSSLRNHSLRNRSRLSRRLRHGIRTRRLLANTEVQGAGFRVQVFFGFRVQGSWSRVMLGSRLGPPPSLRAPKSPAARKFQGSGRVLRLRLRAQSLNQNQGSGLEPATGSEIAGCSHVPRCRVQGRVQEVEHSGIRVQC